MKRPALIIPALAFLAIALSFNASAWDGSGNSFDLSQELGNEAYFEVVKGAITYIEFSPEVSGTDLEQDLLDVILNFTNELEVFYAYFRYNQTDVSGGNKNIYILAGQYGIPSGETKYDGLWVRPYWSYTGNGINIPYWQFYENPTDPVGSYKYRVGSTYNIGLTDTTSIPNFSNINFSAMNFYAYNPVASDPWYQNSMIQVGSGARYAWYSAASSSNAVVNDSMASLDKGISSSDSVVDSAGSLIKDSSSLIIDPSKDFSKLENDMLGKGHTAYEKGFSEALDDIDFLYSSSAYYAWRDIMGAFLYTGFDINLTQMIIFTFSLASIAILAFGKRGD